MVLIALFTLNASVDIPDYILYHGQVPQDNSDFNEVESVAELLCEHALNIHGQFPDKKNDSSNHHHPKKINSTKFADKRLEYRFTGFSLAEYQLPVFRPMFFTDFTKETLSPPPQA